MTQPSPKYDYTPSDFFVLSLFTAILCGIFSPLTLAFTIPAVLLSQRVCYKSVKVIIIIFKLIHTSSYTTVVIFLFPKRSAIYHTECIHAHMTRTHTHTQRHTYTQYTLVHTHTHTHTYTHTHMHTQIIIHNSHTPKNSEQEKFSGREDQ